MAAHLSKQIGDALAALIVAANTPVGARVSIGRVTLLSLDELPAILIEDRASQIEPQVLTSAPYLQARTGELAVQICVRALDDYDADVYEIVKAVEHAIAASPTLGGLTHDLHPSAIEIERDGDADQPLVRATVTVTYSAYTLSNAVDVPI